MLPIRDLMHLMIVVSDNTATNLILDRIGVNAVNQRMAQLGLTQTAVMRKIMQTKPESFTSLIGLPLEPEKRMFCDLPGSAYYSGVPYLPQAGGNVGEEAAADPVKLGKTQQRYKHGLSADILHLHYRQEGFTMPSVYAFRHQREVCPLVLLLFPFGLPMHFTRKLRKLLRRRLGKRKGNAIGMVAILLVGWPAMVIPCVVFFMAGQVQRLLNDHA